MYLSILIPVWNEEKNIKPLYDEITDIMKHITEDYEIIFVDDGSSDNTFSNLVKIRSTDSHLKIILLASHTGKSAALDAGFGTAKGRYVITMDGDLQDNPHEIPKFLDELRNNEDLYDVIVGWKYNRKDSFWRRMPSKIFNRFTNWLTGIRLHDSDCCFKIFKSEVTKSLRIYGELHRFIPSIAKWMGYHVSEIKVNHRKRLHGKSKWGVSRLMKGSLDLMVVKFLISYVKRPMHIFGSVGIVSFGIGFLGIFYMFYQITIKGVMISTELFMLGILLILIGVQLTSVGFLGEMLAYMNERRNYRIAKKLL